MKVVSSSPPPLQVTRNGLLSSTSQQDLSRRPDSDPYGRHVAITVSSTNASVSRKDAATKLQGFELRRNECQLSFAKFAARRCADFSAAEGDTWHGGREGLSYAPASVSSTRVATERRNAGRRGVVQCALSSAWRPCPTFRGEYSDPVFEDATKPKSQPATVSVVDTTRPDEPLHSAMASAMKLDRRDFLCALLLLLGMRALPAAEVDPEGVVFNPPDVDAFVRAEPRPDIPLAAFGGETLGTGREPQQVHVSLAGPNRMQVSWVTTSRDSPSTVEYGKVPGGYDTEATGKASTYSYLGWRSDALHHVVLGVEAPLEDDTVYYYRCGGEGAELSFKTPPAVGPNSPLQLHVLGDLGQTGWSVSTLEHMSRAPHDIVLYAGDLSYADRYQPRWDSWGRLIEPLASSRPWMMVAGNHEMEKIWGLEPLFKAYHARWPMPYEAAASPSNLFYSFEAGCAHFLMLGSYADYSVGSEQYSWLQADLAKVDRQRTPWLIAVLHAPWYNSNRAHQGDGDAMMAAMEPLLHRHRVDFLFAGHVHAYERSTRSYRGLPHAAGTIHVTIGDGGNREGLASSYINPAPEWSMKREASFGHGELTLLNATTARWEWHRNQDDQAVVADGVWIQCLSDPSHPANQIEGQPLRSSI